MSPLAAQSGQIGIARPVACRLMRHAVGAVHTIRHDDGHFEVPGIGRFQHRNEETFAPLEVIGDVWADALRDAIRHMIDHYGVSDDDLDSDPTWTRVNLTDDPYAIFDRDFSPRLPVHLELEHDDITVVVRTNLEVDEEDELNWLTLILQPLAQRLDVHVAAEQDQDAWPGRAHVRVMPPMDGQTVNGLLEKAEPFRTLAEATSGSSLTPATTANLIRGRYPQVLLGQPESQWLEAKGQPPRTATAADNLDFAKYVAAFANTDTGGLVL
jgi:hypothetical protein